MHGVLQEILTQPLAIAGTGKLAQALATLLAERGVRVHTVSARGDALRALPGLVGHVLIAVSDGAIGEVAANLAKAGLTRSIVLHTSGATGPGALDVLRAAGNSVGVLHPLQTVPSVEKGVEKLPGSTFALAGDPEAAAWGAGLIELLNGKPLPVNPDRWHHYHAGAVMACNYQMTLVDCALELMAVAGIARGQALDALAPILRATIDNVLAAGPACALTGPIRRGDVQTIARHLAAVNDVSPETKALYLTAGLRTIPLAERAGLGESAAGELKEILSAETV